VLIAEGAGGLWYRRVVEELWLTCRRRYVHSVCRYGSFVSGLYSPEGDLDVSIEGELDYGCAFHLNTRFRCIHSFCNPRRATRRVRFEGELD